MSEAVVVENAISRFGLRRLHVMRMGQAVDVRNWLRFVPREALHLLEVFHWYEKGLDMYHACLIWNAREGVLFSDGEGQFESVFWFVDVKHGENIRFGVDVAAILFERRFSRQPEAALVSRLPEDAPGWLTTEGGAGFAPVRVRLAQDERLPERYVVVR